MLRAIERIRRYTQGLDAEAFAGDEMVFDATVRNFEILGEAAKHVPRRLRRHYTDAPWRKIVDMRNWVSHDYAGANPHILWNTIEQRLDPLGRALRAMLEELDAQPSR